jgi:hypothetical protein
MTKVRSLTLLAALLSGLAMPVGTVHAASPKVVLIVMENKTYNRIAGNSSAPYLNALMRQGKLFTDYHAVIVGSTRNYRAMTSGLTQGGATGPNLFRSMDQKGVSWKEFNESMTVNCGGRGDEGKVPGVDWPLYDVGHDAARLYKSTNTCTRNDVPMTNANFNPANLPDFSFVVPNNCDNMHTAPKGSPCPAYFGGVSGANATTVGDNWLKVVVPQLLAQPDVTVLITWDEGTDRSGQHIVMLEVGAGVPAGAKDAARYDHYGLLAGLYAKYGLGTPPNKAATSRVFPIP